MYTFLWLMISGCCLFSSIFSESFVKEKAHKDKKVSLARCQEKVLMPLALLIQQTQETALLGNNLVQTGSDIVTTGNRLATQVLQLQKQALEATADLLDEDRHGGLFAHMSLAELDAYSEKLATIHKQLMALQTTLEEKQHTCSTLVDSLKKNVAESLKEYSL